jgi:hypothetical protein
MNAATGRQAAVWLAAAAFLCAGCSLPFLKGDAGAGVIEAQGFGKPEKDAVSEAQKKYESHEAAVIDAQGKLLILLEGRRFKAAGPASKPLRGDAALTEKVKGALRGATEVSAQWDDALNCVVILRVDPKTLRTIDDILKP